MTVIKVDKQDFLQRLHDDFINNEEGQKVYAVWLEDRLYLQLEKEVSNYIVPEIKPCSNSKCFAFMIGEMDGLNCQAYSGDTVLHCRSYTK